jgi:radical SAM superfamily enzyme YgiQ (UPF0313 family)
MTLPVDILIIGDNNFMSEQGGIARASGGHRIATHLRQHGHRVEMIDFITHWTESEWHQALDCLVSDNTLMLGIAANLITDDEQVDRYTDIWRQRFPNKPVVMGGNNLLSRRCRNIDYYIEGYAEQAVLDFMRFLKKELPHSGIKWSNFMPGVALIACNQDYKNIDTSDLTIRYLPSDHIQPNETLALETARGCLFKCKFCTYPLIGKKKLDYLRDIQTIVDEVRFNYEHYGTRHYTISEDTFNDSLFKIESLHAAFEKLPFTIEFMCYAKVELMIANPTLPRLMSEMGMRGVHFGIETFNRRAGQAIGKGMDPARIKDGLLRCREEMPLTSITCSNIVGIPYQSDDDCWAARDWYEKSGIDHWNWQPLYLPNPKLTMHNSEFGSNHLQYGLVPLREDEIQALIKQEKEEMGTDTVQRASFARNTVRNKLILWKNKFTGKNYFDASKLTMALNEASVTRKWSPWAVFEHAHTGFPIQEMRTWGYHNVFPNVPKALLLERTVAFITAYKHNKLQSLGRADSVTASP